MQTKSPRSDVREVYTHRAADKPDLVKLERSGDAAASLAAAYVHGASSRVSRALAGSVAQQLEVAGYRADVRPAEGALLLDVPLTASNGNAAIAAVRHALMSGFAQGKTGLAEEAASALELPSACGRTNNDAPVAPGRRNTALAVVGDTELLGLLADAYEHSPAWPEGELAAMNLPEHDEHFAQLGVAPAELLVGVRTPARERVIPAARFVAARDSLLGLLARSHNGNWEVTSAEASFVPAGGGCLTVRLTAHRTVTPLYAARAAKAVARELYWTLDNEVTDEDARFNVLEASSAGEAALRAAWEAVTARVGEPAQPTRFFGYRGPEIDGATWTRVLEAESAPEPLPVVSRDEPGQGRVWAALGSRCAYSAEDATTAGHTAGALVAAAHAPSVQNVAPFTSHVDLGLVAWQATRSPGAEDRVAQELARSVLQVLVTPSLANEVERLPPSDLDSPPWTLALTLATGGHPSWLSRRSTPQSRGLFDADALGHAMRQFLSGPLDLAILTNQGQAQAQRLAARLAHLLSGVYSAPSQCLPPTSHSAEPPAGEYDVEAPDHPFAVLLYVVDRRFSISVRQLAGALNGPRGWLSRSVVPLGASARAVGLGDPSTMAALGITVSAETPEALSRAISQVRVLVADLPKAPPASVPAPPPPLPLSPEERLAQLLDQSSDAETSSPSAEMSELISEGLTERRLFLVRPLIEPPPAPDKRSRR